MKNRRGSSQKGATPAFVTRSVILFCLCCRRLLYGVRKHRHVSCTLDRYSERSLVLCAVAGDSSRKNLASLRDVSLELSGILVIDRLCLRAAEYADLSSSADSCSSRSRVLRFIRLHCWHLKILLNGSRSSVERKSLIFNPVRNIHKAVTDRALRGRTA